jgi:hypothetical protein
MKKVLLAVALLAGVVFGQTENYSGMNDTAVIATFKADSLKTSKAYTLSQFENLRVDVLVSDTSAAGFASDSVKLYWGIQTGRICWNSSGTRDTAWSNERITLDTLDMLTTTNAALKYNAMDNTGAYTNTLKAHDTLSVSGFAVQSRNISPEWDVLFRCWVKGLTGNKVGRFLVFRFNVVRRIGVNTRSR